MPGASEARIMLLNEDLKSASLPKIPDDYQHFLRQANGAQSPAFILYGTDPQSLAGGRSVEDIVEASQKVSGFLAPELDKSIVVGEVAGGLKLIFNDAQSHYALVDVAAGDVLYEYENLRGFITDWLERHGLVSAPS